VIESRAELEQRYAEMERRWPDDMDVPLPGFWGGYLVSPQVIEFWHGRANRMHDRLRYRRPTGSPDGSWIIERLAP
jgi:pyridoxamine 5'-phosphate oxidase